MKVGRGDGMNIKKWTAVFGTALILSLGAMTAEASLWPGLASKVSEKSGAFRTDDYHIGNTILRSPYLIAHYNNELFAGTVNAAIAREKNDFLNELKKDNETKRTEGWMIWHEGLIGNFINNNQGITSIVLVMQKLKAGEDHGTTFAKGLNFDGTGRLFTLSELLPRLTVEDVNKCIETTAKKKNIPLLPNHRVIKLPENFYVGKNRVVYAIYQQHDLTPAEYGVFSVAVGKL